MIFNRDQKQIWLPYAASVAGVKHEPGCGEDSFFTASMQMPEHMITGAAVCDGISDRRAGYAMFGAQLFSRSAVEFLMPRFELLWSMSEQELNTVTVEFRQEALKTLENWRDRMDVLGVRCSHVMEVNDRTGGKTILSSKLQEYATTLQTVLVSDDGRMIYLSIGDGCCQVQVGHEMVPLSCIPWSADRGTAHITFPSIGTVLCHLRYQRLWLPAETAGIYVMTDGGKFPTGLYNGKTMQAEAALRKAAGLLKKRVNSTGSLELEALLTDLRSAPENDQSDDITLPALYSLIRQEATVLLVLSVRDRSLQRRLNKRSWSREAMERGQLTLLGGGWENGEPKAQPEVLWNGEKLERRKLCLSRMPTRPVDWTTERRRLLLELPESEHAQKTQGMAAFLLGFTASGGWNAIRLDSGALFCLVQEDPNLPLMAELLALNAGSRAGDSLALLYFTDRTPVKVTENGALRVIALKKDPDWTTLLEELDPVLRQTTDSDVDYLLAFDLEGPLPEQVQKWMSEWRSEAEEAGLPISFLCRGVPEGNEHTAMQIMQDKEGVCSARQFEEAFRVPQLREKGAETEPL